MDIDHRRRYYPRCPRTFLFLNLAILVGCVGLYGLSRWVLIPALDWVVLSSFFHDLLAGPLLLAYTNLLFHVLKRDEKGLYKLRQILPLTLVAGLFWEYVGPLIRANSVSDPLDLLAYVGGGFLYWAVWRGIHRCVEL